LSQPGRGRAVQEIWEALGDQDVKLMQRTFYNGHYKYHGGKIQHVLQAYGMAHSFMCPIWNHDALVLRTSSMFLMLSALYINGDWNHLAKTVTDKAYRQTPHFQPLHTEAEITMMGAGAKIAAADFDKRHKQPRLAVENSFSQQVTKFWNSDTFRSHKVTQSGRSNLEYLQCLWDLQTFMFNLYTCSAGSQGTGALGVSPPSVHEHLYSCNNNLSINIPDDENEFAFQVENV